MQINEIDLTDRGLFRRGFPHEVFSLLRREAPVWLHPVRPGSAEIGGQPFWVLSRHADIQAANRDTEVFSAGDGPALVEAPPERRGKMLVSTDGSAHLRLRKLINAGFTPRMIAQLEGQARNWAISIVESALEKETCNFVDDVAYQLPMHMIADIVGIPPEDRSWLFSKASDFLQCTDPEHPVPASQRSAIQSEMFQYGKELGKTKRKKPQDDVWTILTTVEITTDDGLRTGLSEMELDLFFTLLLIGGSETTRNVVSLALLALLDNPHQLERLRRDGEIMRSATEEFIRWASPVAYFRRTVTRDTTLAGVRIAAGDRVTLWYPSGNRDEGVFDDPFRFDISRSPNHHVAFGGGGPHFCLGSHLARREISVLFEELLARTARIEPTGEPRYSVQGIGNPTLVSVKELPVRLTPH